MCDSPRSFDNFPSALGGLRCFDPLPQGAIYVLLPGAVEQTLSREDLQHLPQGRFTYLPLPRVQQHGSTPDTRGIVARSLNEGSYNDSPRGNCVLGSTSGAQK